MGCGWLGLPLAKSLVQEGYLVYGTTTSEEKLTLLEKEGIHPFHIALSDTEIRGPISNFLNSCETLIVNVPPKLRGSGPNASYVGKMKLVLNHIKDSTIKQVIFVSSTSVYGDTQGVVTEETIPQPTSESGRQLIVSEQLFKNQTKINPTIVRFGGLIGPDRHPVTLLVKKEFLTDGTAPVNLIHLNDCIRILSAIIKEDQWGETFNAVHPNHPEKQHYYPEKARFKGLKRPYYETSENKIYKTITSCKPFLTKLYADFTPL
jgi:nucleoside-diphosphate-sugar epimerase